MDRIPFNDDNTNKGAEGWYGIENDTLVIYVVATNSCEDWITNFKAWPEKLYPESSVWVHAGYKKYAFWLKDYFQTYWINETIEKIILIGYSMGGGIVQVLKTLLFLPGIEIKVINIDGPRTVYGPNSAFTTQIKTVTYYNRGSLVHAVPPWFKEAETEICLNSNWRPAWISHADYDIKAIIEKEIA